MIKRETIVAGNLISRRYYGSPERVPGEKRKVKTNPTAEAVAKINMRNSERELTMKLHHNFSEGDIHAVLTYAGAEPTEEQAKKDLKNFIAKLRRHFKKEGKTLKWIMVTEYKNHRIHHHMIISRMDTKVLDDMWQHGHVRPTHLDSTGDYRKLASYLIKETSKTFREPDAVSRQRFSTSRTVVAPVKKVEEVRTSEMIRDPKPIKGYHIIPDSVYRGVNPVTGIPYMEMMMISITKTPRLITWPRGKKYRYKEKYHDEQHRQLTEFQCEFDLEEMYENQQD